MSQQDGQFILGIIGGMGPEATVELMRRIVQRTPADDDAGHIRMLVDNNPKVPSRLAYLLEGGKVDPAPVLAKMARGLQSAGASHLVMPCNTAHHFIEGIRAAVDIPFVNMLEVSFMACGRNQPPGANIGILGSPALQVARVLDRYGAAMGFNLIYPAANLSDSALTCIKDVKAGRADAGSYRAYATLKQSLRSQGADVLLVCCTEFSVLEAGGTASAGCIDTLDELVTAVLALAHP
jgi:aspartate racemase